MVTSGASASRDLRHYWPEPSAQRREHALGRAGIEQLDDRAFDDALKVGKHSFDNARRWLPTLQLVQLDDG